jgi:hypothetical protein
VTELIPDLPGGGSRHKCGNTGIDHVIVNGEVLHWRAWKRRSRPYRLLLDLDADGSLRTALTGAPSPLRRVVRAATQKVLINGAVRIRG